MKSEWHITGCSHCWTSQQWHPAFSYWYGRGIQTLESWNHPLSNATAAALEYIGGNDYVDYALDLTESKECPDGARCRFFDALEQYGPGVLKAAGILEQIYNGAGVSDLVRSELKGYLLKQAYDKALQLLQRVNKDLVRDVEKKLNRCHPKSIVCREPYLRDLFRLRILDKVSVFLLQNEQDFLQKNCNPGNIRRFLKSLIADYTAERNRVRKAKEQAQAHADKLRKAGDPVAKLFDKWAFHQEKHEKALDNVIDIFDVVDEYRALAVLTSLLGALAWAAHRYDRQREEEDQGGRPLPPGVVRNANGGVDFAESPDL